MKSYMKKLGLALLASLAWSAPAFAGHPSNGVKPPVKVNVYDSRAKLENADMGWRVWVTSGTSSAELVLDWDGAAPTSGILHRVCTSSGNATSETFQVWDSSSADTTTARELYGPLNRATAAYTCSGIIDDQFNRGLVVKQSVTSGLSYLEWRPYGQQR